MRSPRAFRYVLAAAGLLVASAASAASFGLEEVGKKVDLPQGNVTDSVSHLISVALGFVGTLFLILMLYAGFLYLTAQGDKEKVQKAKQLILGAVIGIVIISGAYGLTKLVISTAGGAAQHVPEKGSVPLGGACTDADQCADSLTICDGGVCTSFTE